MNKFLRPADIDNMTVEERLELIEQLWASLEQVPETAVPLPKWQEDEIARRLKALDEGSSVGVPLEEAMSRILGKS